MNWIMENLGTIIVCIILGIAVALTTRFLYKCKKSGKCVGCGSDCGSCSSCHSPKVQEDNHAR